jgi:hypothetical protein
MTLGSEEQSFVMIFRRELMVGLTPKMSGGSFQAENVRFESVDADHFTAFCDRLVDSQGQLVGVEITAISEPAKALIDTVRTASYVTAAMGALRVWFSEGPIDDASNTAEQAFGGQVFRSPTGDLALSIDADFLFVAADEIRLLNAHAKWLTISGS